MKGRDVALLALKNLRRRRIRTVLSAIAIALGSSLLVALLVISSTADSRVVSQLSKGGPLTAIHVDDSRPAPNSLSSDNMATAGHHDITPGLLTAIRESQYVSTVIGVLALPVVAVPCPAGGQPSSTTPWCANPPKPYAAALVGVDLAQAQSLPITVLAGRLPATDSSYQVAVGQAYLDHLGLQPSQAAKVLGTEVALGTPRVVGDPDQVQSRWSQARIVGVVAQSVDQGDFLVPSAFAEAARQFALSGDPEPNFTGWVNMRYNALVVIADRLDHVHQVRAELYDLGFASSAPEHLLDAVLRYLHVVDIVLAGIGLVGLAIAVLGIANTMLAAVRERWREIGVLKAIGARDADVMSWFLIEAGSVGLAGGIVGTAIGLGIAWAVGLDVNAYLTSQGLPGVDLGTLPFGLVLLAPPGTALLAMLAGVAPALQAARLPAREAIGAL
jgi:putative ABC transport system permease protein